MLKWTALSLAVALAGAGEQATTAFDPLRDAARCSVGDVRLAQAAAAWWGERTTLDPRRF